MTRWWAFPRLDLTKAADRQQHDAVVTLVDKLLTLHRERAAALTDAARAAFTSRIALTDGQLDRLVYGLYGLSTADIAHIEGAAK